MSDPQIVRLKKEIELLREHNVQLKIQLEQQAEQLGQMEYQHLNIMNKNLMLQEEKKLSEDSTKLEKIISAALINEKQEEYRKKCEELTKEKNDYLEQIKDNEIYIQKLQQDNSRLKKDLLDFGQKHEAQDYIDKIKMKDLEIQKVIEEKADIVRDWDDLRDKMEEVLKENRVLRQIADVPENFGIDISKINLGDRIKIEDYKAKIRILQHEVDLLETERAKLKYKIEFLADSFQSKEEPFSKLNKEQKVELANFALKLYNEKDKNNIQSEKYDYIREIRKKDEIIKNLENDLSIYRAQLQNKGIPSGIGKLSHNQMDEIIQMIKENQKDVINMINTNKEIAQNNPKLNTTNNLNFNEENTDKNFKLKTAQNLGKNVLLTNTSNSNININNNTINRFNNETDTNLNNNNLTNYNNNDNDIIFNLEQLPPVPIYDPHKPNNTSYAKSYKFNSKIKIAPQLLNNLFGISEDLDNSDDLKKMAIALQSQLIEMIEIESRRNDNDTKLNNNLKSLFNKYEKLAIILKQIFERYMKFKLKFEENEKALNEKLDKNNAELLVLKKVNDIYQSTIEKIEKKDLGDTEKAILEKMKQNAILESDLEKLKRKYKNLFEDEKKLREYLEMTEKYNLEKEKNMRNNITRLKDWKNILMFYLRFLNDKLKKSVDRDKFDLMVEENKYLREKNSQLTLRDIEVTKETTNNQTLLMKYKDLEDSYFNLQEAKYDIEIELNFMQKRIEELDPEYNNEQIAFRKLVNKLTALNMSFDQIKYAFATFDKNKDNNNNKSNVWDDLYFMKDLNSSNSIKDKKSFEECLRKNLGINEQEITKTDLYYIYRVLNCEDEDIVDLRKFMRKLELYAISERNKKNNEFEVLEKLIKCAQDKNKSLLEAFSFFDTNNNGCITRDEFIYTLSQLGFQVSDENIDKLIFLVSGESPIDKDNNIHFLDEKDNFNYIEFCELFEKKAKNVILKNRKTTINKNRDKIDWKINLLTKIYFTLNNIHMKIDTVFDSFEKTEKGFLSLDEFSSFLIHIGMEINSDNLKKLFLSFNNDYKINREINPKNYFVKTEKIIEELNKVAIRANEY